MEELEPSYLGDMDINGAAFFFFDKFRTASNNYT